jgi:hypothetical protein
VDTFSLYTVLVPAASKSAETIIKSIKDHIIQPFTAPSALRSDGELGLIQSQLSQEFAYSHGIQLLPTAPYSPWSNSSAEGRIKVVKQLLRNNIEANNDKEWDDSIYLLQTALNSTVGSYGYSPEEIHFGFANVRPTDPLIIRAPPLTQDAYMTCITQNLQIMYANLAAARAKHKEENDAFCNARRETRHFEVGQLVYTTSMIIAANSGLLRRKRGPYVVTEVSSHSQTAALYEISTGKHVKQHFAYIVPLKETKMSPKLNSDWDKALREFQEHNNQPIPT